MIKRNIEIIAAIVAFVLVFTFFLICNLEDKLFLGLIGTIATLYFGAVKHRIENDKFFKELFLDFNKRYDNKLNDLLNELKNDDSRILKVEERNKIIDYFNLCSEEYFWKKKNRIPKEVWNSWKAGIMENLRIKQVNKIYQEEKKSPNNEKSYYGLIEELGI
jgi:uncharacterized membrane-anchored protein YjiN (DUF445 family)